MHICACVHVYWFNDVMWSAFVRQHDLRMFQMMRDIELVLSEPLIFSKFEIIIALFDANFHLILLFVLGRLLQSSWSYHAKNTCVYCSSRRCCYIQTTIYTLTSVGSILFALFPKKKSHTIFVWPNFVIALHHTHTKQVLLIELNEKITSKKK